ncbi:efflux RND transporter permease subunit [Candidatus Peregrinibacteria bacterium]|nr:efflux RND transporter permease subunit [Candidatus Peregrinibacteria bacterium]
MSFFKKNQKTEESHESQGDSLYLDKLEFTEDAKKTFLNYFIENFRVIILIIISLIIWGVYSFQMLPLESNPEVKIPFGVITVSLPGASPEDMEELIIKKIEPRVSRLKGVKEVDASAGNSFALITVEFRAEEELNDAIRRLRDAVDGVKADLPADASDPIVSEISFSNSPIWTLVISGPYDNFTLREYAEKVKEELEKLQGTSEVTIDGGDLYEIRVSYDPQKLATYHLSIDQVNNQIKGANFSLPSGNFTVSKYEYSVNSINKFTDAAELRKLPIAQFNGQIIRLQDVATVMERAAERTSYSKFSLNGGEPQNAVTLNIVKKTGFSIIDLIDDGKANVQKLKDEGLLPQNVNIETTLDISKIIRRDFDQLVNDGLSTILLVTIVLFLFVGLKEAFVAGLAVPLVFAASFGVMLMLGMTLNFLSLFSLILALGLLVDDAIVVVQATKQYLKTGKFTPEEAVLLVFRDFKVLLFTTTITTIWAFLPLLLATGIIGQFIRSIPITVSVTLATSYFVAIVINHPMAIILERFRLTRGPLKAILWILGLATVGTFVGVITSGAALGALIGFAICGVLFFSLFFVYRSKLRDKLKINEDLLLQEQADPEKIKAKIYHHYLAEGSQKSFWNKVIGGLIKVDAFLPSFGRFLNSILQSRFKKVLVLIFAIILFAGSVTLPATGVLKSEFIPPADSEYMYVNIEGAPGLILEDTAKVADEVEKVLLAEKNINNFTMVIGSGGVNTSNDLTSDFGGGGGKTHLAQFAVNLYPLKERPKDEGMHEGEKSYEIAPKLREKLSHIKGANVTVMELSSGPPAGADFQANILGEDRHELEKIANRYKDILASIPGTVNEKTSIKLSPGEFTFKFKPDQLQLHGISSAQVAFTLRAALSGVEVTKLFRGNDEISVHAEFADGSLPTIDSLKTLQLTNNLGQAFSLGDVADVTLEPALTSLSRIDQKRVITLSASVEAPTLPTDVLAQFQEKIKEDKLPAGYEIQFGGANETNNESIFSILRAMIVAMMLIVGTLVIQFNSFRKAVLVLAAIPLAMTGVFYGLAAIGFTLSFPTLIGILALFGIVVKNAVILVDKINLNLRVGIEYTDAIVDAAKSRLEAIFLTSICTIIGMVPLTLHNETWKGLGAALMFGLAASTLLTLVVIPVLFHMTMRGKYAKQEKLALYEAELAKK